MKETDVIHHPDVFFAQGLTEKQRVQRQKNGQKATGIKE